jgi:membrane protein DedA with SNARE-associated domain
LQHFIATYGYLAVFVLMVAESACIPIPSELIMTFAGALAAGAVAGTHLNLVGVIVAGAAGNVVGSYIAWGVGRYGGQAALRRWGRRIRLSEHDLDRANRWFDRYGSPVIVLSRCIPFARAAFPYAAGVARMPFGRFFAFATLGSVIWISALGVLGNAVGSSWQSWRHNLEYVDYVAAALLVAAIVYLVVRIARTRDSDPAAVA